MGTAIIVIILSIVIIIGVKNSITHMKGEGGCCGGGGSIIEEKKVLENTVIGRKIVHIEGMHCENCKNSIERQINRIDGASCKVNLKKKTAVIEYDREIDNDKIRRTIQMLDFNVTDIQNEKIIAIQQNSTT